MRTMRLTAGAALAMALVALGTARAGVERAGTTAADFLSLGSGTRVLGMGGATLGLGDDLGGAAWNPAAAGWLLGYEAALAHAALADRSTQEWGAFGGRIGGSQTRWAVTGLYQGDGSIQGRDASGAATGNLSVASMAFGALVSQRIGPHLTLGAGAKLVTERLASVSGTGFTFDAGLMARAGRVGFGVAAQNVGGHMSYGGLTYPFPSSVGAGIAFTDPRLGVRLALDANFPSTYHADLRAGAEWIHRGGLALRAGYRRELAPSADPLNGPTFGVGARAAGLWIDYGYLLPGGGASQHRLGLRFPLGARTTTEPAAAAPPKKEKPDSFDWARGGTNPPPATKPAAKPAKP
jgi:hypothetical protein